VLFFLCAPATKIIVEDEYHRIDSWLIAGGLVGAIAGGYPYLRHRARDLFGLTCIGFAVAWIITVLASRTLNVFKSGNCGGLVIVGLLVVGMLTVLVRWIRRLNDELQPEAQQPDALLPETPPPAAHPPAARPPAARPPETRDE
jgi:hypothetical protein